MLGFRHASNPVFPIVGVGASAGGLEAFTQLLQHLPADTGLAFVLIQHLDRTHPSQLSEALAKATTMHVQQAEHGMRVEPGHVYVIAPNTDLAIRAGHLVVSPRNTDVASPHMPVDFFLCALASELGSQAIGVVLSGSASDGTRGLAAIRTHDGITLSQDPRSAKYAGMPQSAVDAGVVDYCLPIPQLAEELVRLSRHAYVGPSELALDAREASLREQIFVRVRDVIGVDFNEFKPATAARRLARRLLLRNVVDLQAYLALLETEPEEIRALYEDMLIHVTAFFRDPKMYEALRAQVFPEILKHKLGGVPLRIWVAGCSTGEEVYSIAIELLEYADALTLNQPIQIFGSDVSDLAIQRARAGVYGDSALAEVSQIRLERYFSKVEGGRRIDKRVRDLCVFLRHDLVRDAPLSRIDLISCRNVLIYFDQPLQKRVLPILHYSLNEPGFLVLGRNENIGGFSQLFSVVDKGCNVFRRTPAPSSLRFMPSSATYAPAVRLPERGRGAFPDQSGTYAKHLDRLLLARYCPAGVLVNENMDVLLFRGQTGAYLQPAPGQPKNNLISMARGGLVAALRSAIAEAKQEVIVVRRPGVEVDHEASTKTCDVVVLPFIGPPQSQQEPLFVVLFEAPAPAAAQPTVLEAAVRDQPTSAERQRAARLEHELTSIKEYLYTLVEEHGRASDELGTSNEELISGNEELQSTNEELETAKEELQSVNEELSTLNDELRSRNDEVGLANSDLLNFALTVDVAVLTLDMERRIRRFTPKAHSVFELRPGDVGRSIDEIPLKFDVSDLGTQVRDVLATGQVKEREVTDKRGRWYRMHIRPYIMNERISGAIVSLVDIDHLKQLVTEAQAARIEAERANRAKDEFLAMLSHELRTPLSIMLLSAQRLRSGDLDAAESQHMGEVLERATRQQAKLIEDLLDVSRISAGKLSLEFAAVDLCACVREAVAALRPMCEAKGLAVQLSLEPPAPLIWADSARLQQIISNLLNNAIKFTPHGGQLNISVDATATVARLRVTDTGVGIDASFLPQLFTRFAQRDSSITRVHGGLGLGLALVRQLVELHGGTVQAQSAGLGQGASFTAALPLLRASDSAAVALQPAVADRTSAFVGPANTRTHAGLSGLRVLFIDDDQSTREAVLDVLELAGARVQLAASAAEGATALVGFQAQVIVCDIAMPGEDGYSFIRKLRARETVAGGAIPALALTALASNEDKRRALEAGFQRHMAKPIDIDHLRSALLELSHASQ